MLEEAHDREELIGRVAALDIGKAQLVCCVRVPGESKRARRLQEVTTYKTMTRSLVAMSDRLGELGVTRVVMEATSDLLEAALLPAGSGRVRGLAGQCQGRPSTCRAGPRPTSWLRCGCASSPSGSCCGPASCRHRQSAACGT